MGVGEHHICRVETPIAALPAPGLRVGPHVLPAAVQGKHPGQHSPVLVEGYLMYGSIDPAVLLETTYITPHLLPILEPAPPARLIQHAVLDGHLVYAQESDEVSVQHLYAFDQVAVQDPQHRLPGQQTPVEVQEHFVQVLGMEASRDLGLHDAVGLGQTVLHARVHGREGGLIGLNGRVDISTSPSHISTYAYYTQWLHHLHDGFLNHIPTDGQTQHRVSDDR